LEEFLEVKKDDMMMNIAGALIMRYVPRLTSAIEKMNSGKRAQIRRAKLPHDFCLNAL
jgi:hypothetical protein